MIETAVHESNFFSSTVKHISILRLGGVFMAALLCFIIAKHISNFGLIRVFMAALGLSSGLGQHQCLLVPQLEEE